MGTVTRTAMEQHLEDDLSRVARTFVVKVPAGAKPGDKMSVEHDGNTFFTLIPDGAKPGDEFEMVLPDPKDEPDGITVTVPAGAKAGDELSVKHEGRTFVTTIPDGVKPGQKFKVKLPSSSDEDPNAITTTVPKGARAGDTLTVRHNGGTFKVSVPEGAKPGDTFQCVLPSTPSSESGMKVKVPAGAEPGDEITVNYKGNDYGVAVPEGALPGDTFMVELPDADDTPAPVAAVAAAPVAAVAAAPAPSRGAASVIDRVLALEEALGENSDLAISGLMPRVKHIEMCLFGEVQSGKIPDRVAALEEMC